MAESVDSIYFKVLAIVFKAVDLVSCLFGQSPENSST